MNKFRFTLICLFFASVMQAQQNDIVVIIRPVTQGYDYVKSADIQELNTCFPRELMRLRLMKWMELQLYNFAE